MPPLDFSAINETLRAKFGNSIREVDVVSYSQYPKVSSVVSADESGYLISFPPIVFAHSSFYYCSICLHDTL